MNVAWPNLYLLTALMGVAACSVGPQYQAPDVAPIQLASAQAQAFARADMPLPPAWWTFFDDRQLEQLIATAVASNHDIRVARANLLLARASLDQAERARLPVVTSGLAYQRSRAQPPTAGGGRRGHCPSPGVPAWTCNGSWTCSAVWIT